MADLEVAEEVAPVRVLGQHAHDRLLHDPLGDARLTVTRTGAQEEATLGEGNQKNMGAK